MTAMQNIRHLLADDLEHLNSVIRQQLQTNNPLMDKVIEHYLQTKGKLIRPIMVMLTARMFGCVSDKVLSAAAAVELLHNASLIHDDIVDQATTRRGMPTINAVWDNHIAVLVGDFFVSSSMQQAISTGNVKIIDALCHLGKLLSLGELDQIYNARYHTLTEESYYQIINYKTASLFVACARMGCFAVGVDDERLEAMSRFAELLGMCFQIRDDIFDYFAESEDLGKPTGNDLREGKITLPLLHVLLETSDEKMLELSQKEILDEKEIEELIQFAVNKGGVEYAYAKMREMQEQATTILNEKFADCNAKKALLELFDYVISREG